MWLSLVNRNFYHDNAIYHESDTIGPNRHNLSIGGEFNRNYTGSAGIGIYCCWYEGYTYYAVSLCSPKLTSKVYHDRSGDGGDNYSPDIGGWFGDDPVTQRSYGLFYMNDLDKNEVHVLLSSPSLTNHRLSSIQPTD